jgi:ketosteroid isomerase-like protein
MPGATEQQLIGLEKQYWDAMVTKDVDTAVRMSDEPVYLAGAQGVSQISNEQYRHLMQDGKWVLHSYDMKKVVARLVSPDVAIIAYTVTEQLTVDGQKLTLTCNDASTWVRKGGEWKCSLHTEAVSGDPFGRDRKSATQPS